MKNTQSHQRYELGMVGLGVMGRNLVLNMADHGCTVAGHPGPRMLLRPVDMQFTYQDSFAAPSPSSYETLLLDIMKSDATLFMRADQVEAAWRVVMPVIEAWATSKPPDFPNYRAGTWRPTDAEKLLAEGHQWPLPTELANKERTNPKLHL
jgi:glucose-6-phosphate 1-dehydrogenase